MTNLGLLYIISAPSGCGKTSLVHALLESTDHLEASVSHTTRPPRASEQSKCCYHFVNEATFAELIKENAFLEYAQVFGHYYGTTSHWVNEKLKAGVDVILEIDWQGARQIKQKMAEAIGIFILPPAWQVLEQRLRQRGQDDEIVIAERMAKAKDEISHYNEYDYLVINNDFNQALADLQAIIHAGRLRLTSQVVKQGNLLKDLS